MSTPAASPAYTLIGYKSDGVDTCRGCVMDRCSSDFELNIFRSQAEVVAHWAKRIAEDEANTEYHSNWNFTLLVDGYDQWTSTGVDADDDLIGTRINQVETSVQQELSKQKAAQEAKRVADKKAATIAAAKAKAQATIAREAAERAELKRLSLKFGDTK